MKLTLLGDEKISSVRATLESLTASLGSQGVEIVTDHESCKGGAFLFALSYAKIVPEDTRRLYDWCFVLHGSSLPFGRGWSPITWQILSGERNFTMSLIHMSDPVDSGDIVAQREFEVGEDLLFEEISSVIGQVQSELIESCLGMTPSQLLGVRQDGTKSYYGKRSPSDSEIDPSKPLSDQWNSLRAADPVRYPSFFTLGGRKYVLRIERLEEN